MKVVFSDSRILILLLMFSANWCSGQWGSCLNAGCSRVENPNRLIISNITTTSARLSTNFEATRCAWRYRKAGTSSWLGQGSWQRSCTRTLSNLECGTTYEIQLRRCCKWFLGECTDCGDVSVVKQFTTLSPSIGGLESIIPQVEYCDGDEVSEITLSTNAAGAVIEWQNDTPEIGLRSRATSNIIDGFIASNDGTSAVTASIEVMITTDRCSARESFNILINPKPTIESQIDETYCNFDIVPENVLEGIAEEFDWTISNSIGADVNSGTGDVPTFMAANSGIIPIQADVNIVASFGNCPEAEEEYTITVNPTPNIVTDLPNIIHCEGEQVEEVILENSIADANIEWANSTPDIGLINGGSTSTIPSFEAGNSEDFVFNKYRAEIDVTAEHLGCIDTASYAIIVNPVWRTRVDTIRCPGDGDLSNYYAQTEDGCDSILIYSNRRLSEAYAGVDQTVCEPETLLEGNMPTEGDVTACWTAINPSNDFDDKQMGTTMIRGLVRGLNPAILTFYHPQCGDYSDDEVEIFFENGGINAVVDTFNYHFDREDAISRDVLRNDEIELVALSPEITFFDTDDLEDFIPPSRSIEGRFTVRRDPTSPEFDITFGYYIQSQDCPSNIDTAYVSIFLIPESGEAIDLLFSPNGDGVNDELVIPGLEQRLIQNPDFKAELVVFNRWGETVYKISTEVGYQNDWNGSHFKTGKPISDGVYFFVLNDQNGFILQNHVQVINTNR